METLAYLHCASAYEETAPIQSVPSQNHPPLFNGLNWKRLSSRVCLFLLPLVMALSVFSSLEQAQAAGTRTLKYGKRGHDVVRLQKGLKYLGYFPSRIRTTGYYGSYTKRAVKRAQRACGIRVDGIVGYNTRDCLNYLYW